ncbi:ABC transporter [Schaalia hyovaginalis]|uniref:ABC transporter n=1 Tax=Schaalia hyovaginalis TaxID=29316 RepID=UPI002A831A6E|nr:ABC transporter [Schaalia hyovaginalis]MDY5600378.1 ABC transporter [Schaalia hyovaginalis]
MRWIRSLRSEEGSEVVSHALVQVIVLIVVLALLQLAFALHTRNMAIAAAGEGARRGGLLGGSQAEAVERTRVLFADLAGAHDARISAERKGVDGAEVLVVTVTTRIPILVSWGPQWLTVSGSSLIEEG